MCVDYTSLNKACPKVPFPLPHIDQIVDSTAGCETLSFLDAYSGYHQIKIKESDQLVTSFITLFRWRDPGRTARPVTVDRTRLVVEGAY
jgi:hypothetical protein